MGLRVSGSQSFQECLREVCWVLYCPLLHTYADDSTILAVVRKLADRPAVAASLNRDFARIQEWCNRWCMILNPNKTKALVVSNLGLWTLHMVTWSMYICRHLCDNLLLFCICSPNPWVLFSGVRVSCWMSTSASRAPGVFGGLSLSWSRFLVIVPSTACCWV